MDDLLKVTAEWNKWIDTRDSKAYDAYVMQPVMLEPIYGGKTPHR